MNRRASYRAPRRSAALAAFLAQWALLLIVVEIASVAVVVVALVVRHG